ncbi:hypothetical protein R6Q57_014396 [Mikania cordata]
MTDMAGVFCNTIALQDNINDMDDYNYDEDDMNLHDDVGENDGGEDDSIEDAGGKDDSSKDDGGKRPWIKRIGRKFAHRRIHRSAINILQQNFDEDWVTFGKVRNSNLREMFNSFKTQWRWDSRDDQYIFDGFVNMLRDRFPDTMSEFREKSRNKAREDGHDIPFGEEKFDITYNYPPDCITLERCQRLCKIWNTDKWLKRSKTGRSNRNNDLSRHIGGSMGYDEHRIKLDKQKGKKVGYELVFIDTHATKETKKRLREGEININDLDELEFVT